MRRLIFIFLAIAIVALVVPGISSAEWINLNLDYPRFGNIELDCIHGISLDDKRDGVQCGQDLTSLIAWLYYGIIMLSGLAAFLMIVWGGVQYLTSSGDPGKTGDATDRMKKALLGLLIILSSWLILQTINPELTTLKMPGKRDIPSQAPVAPPTLSSGGAPIDQECTGQDLNEEASGFTLKDMAVLLCEANKNKTPPDGAIHSYLWLATNGGCSLNDVNTVGGFLESGFDDWTGCGVAAGGTTDGLVIDATTVDASICRNILGESGSFGAKGIIYDGLPGSDVDYVNTFGPDVLKKLKENAAALTEYCLGRDNPFCALHDAAETRLDTFGSPKQDTLAQYCFDII